MHSFKLHVTLLLPLTLSLLLGCEDAERFNEPILTSPRERPSTEYRVRPEEAPFEALSRAAPSSAGFYLDSVGHLVVVVKDAKDDESARSAGNSMLGDGRVVDHRARTASVRIQRGRYSFAELAAYRDMIFDRILGAVAGVLSLDLTEHANRVTVGLANNSQLRAALPGMLTELGVDTFALDYRLFDQVDVSRRSDTEATSVRGVRRTAPNGIGAGVFWTSMVGGIHVRNCQTSRVVALWESLQIFCPPYVAC